MAVGHLIMGIGACGYKDCGKIGGYVLVYRSKDKNTTQGNLAELVGSPVAPLWCK